MQVSKPKEGAPEFENFRKLKIDQEPVTIKAGIIAQIGETSSPKLDPNTISN
jgi:hypothetical protein